METNGQLQIELKGEHTREQVKTAKTQCIALRDWLLSGKRITSPEAGRELLIGHLPRRILDMIEYFKLPIQRQYIKYKRSDGLVTRVKEYWIDEADLQRLSSRNSSMQKT